MLLIMIFNFCVGFADIYVAGFISPEVQAAVGFVGQLYFLIIIIANAISIGTLALVSRAIGSGNLSRSIEVAKQSVILSVCIAIGLMMVGLVFHHLIISTAGFPVKIRVIAESFLKLFALALGPNYILIISNAVFRASGEVRKPLLTMFLVSVINIIADFVLVLGISPFPKMGYIGIALATAVSVTVGMVINLTMFFFSQWRPIYNKPWFISLETIKKIVNLGWPAALLQIAWNAGSILLYNILSRIGESSITALASITNGLRIEAVIYLPAFALNMAASVLIGQNLGAGKPERAEKVGWKIALAGVVLISVMSLIVFILAERVASTVTGSQAVLAETVRYLRINMLAEPLMALSVILGGCLQGAGDTRGTMRVIIAAMWFIRLPLAYFLGLLMHYGATGVWVAMVTSMSIQGIVMTHRFHKGQWKTMRVE